MIHRMYWVALVALLAWPAGAQDRGVLAIDEEAGRHAFSFDSEADAVNMCGTTGCEVVATFSACLAVAYSRVMIQQEQSVWTWIEADTEGAARGGALEECERSGGAACEVLNAYCVADSESRAAAPAATPEQESLFWQSIMNSTNPAEFEAYLAQFPNGVFRALAEARLAALRAPAGDSPAAVGQPAGGADSPTGGVAAGSDARLRLGEAFRDCDGCPEMVVIPAGTFRMGCVSGRDCYDSEQPVHEVTISRPFALSKYEVTFQEYDRFVQETGSERPDEVGWGRGRRPVMSVSWNDAQEYVAWLSRETGARYRLPTEAEWEYAARAGTETAYSWGNEAGRNRANCHGCGSQWNGDRTVPVGSFSPNAWGLHDMHGNVWEWVQDCWNEGYQGAPVDGSAWESGDCSRHVRRGGSWGYQPGALRAAGRGRSDSGWRYYEHGFRVARTLAP